MKKFFCDICKQETKDNYQYILPYWKTCEAQGGKGNIVLIKYNILKDIELDLCEKCRVNLATIIKTLEVK